MNKVGVGLVSLLLLVGLSGCGGEATGGTAPSITSFTATPSSVAAGESVTLSWAITGTATSLTIDGGVGEVAGISQVVTPTATTTYTLTASNSSGNDTETTTVTVGGGTGDGDAPTGTFGASASESGPFQSDTNGGISSPSDSRVVQAEPNSTIYFQASYSDPDGVTEMVPYLANDNVDTDLTPGTSVYGFTSAGPTGCELGATQTAVTCTFAVAVGDIPNITGTGDFPGEFAYVFKVRATDGAGNSNEESSRGYVVVGGDGGGGTTPPPENQDPVAAFSSEQDGSTVVFSAAASSDPDGDTLTYDWDFGDGSSATSRDFTKTYSADGTYTVELTVSDGAGGTDTETASITIGDEPSDNQAPVASFVYTPQPPTPIIAGTTTVTFNASSSTDADGTVSSYAWSVTSPTGGTNTYTSQPLGLKLFQVGTYTISLVVTDDDGAASEPAVQTVTVVEEGSDIPTLTIEVPVNGTVEIFSEATDGIECPADLCTIPFDPEGGSDNMVELTAVPDDGYVFESWGGACTDIVGEVCALTIDSSTGVSVEFAPEEEEDSSLPAF